MWIGNWRFCAATSVLVLAGCAGVPLEYGQVRVVELVQGHAGATVSAEATNDEQAVPESLRTPLQVSTAVRIALLRNPTLQLQFARLGLSAADVFEASRLSNPGVSFAVLFPEGRPSGNKLNAAATLSFSELLLHRARGNLAASQYRRVQELVAASILDLALDVQRAWFDCVAATERAAVRQSIDESAQASSALATRYHGAGNIDELTLQLQGATASEAGIAASQATADVEEARARLQVLVGLGIADEPWTVPNTGPEPVAGDVDVSSLQMLAATERLDLAAARTAVLAAEGQLTVAHRYRLLSPTDLGVAGEREADGSKRIGPSVSLSLPMFKQGQGGIARAVAELASARATQQLLAVQISNEVRIQAERMRVARLQVTSYREALIPQREAVVARLQEQVNFMLTDTFNLLMAKQQEYAAYAGYVAADQAFWSARIELMRAVGTRLPDGVPVVGKNPQVQP